MQVVEGWHSDAYGKREPTQVLLTRQRFADRHRRAWTFSLGGDVATAQVSGYARLEAGALLLYRLEAGGRHEEPGLGFDGELLWLRSGAGGLLTAHAENLLALDLAGVRVRAPLPIRRLTIAGGELRIESDGDVTVDAPALRVLVNPG
jgi:hypothetical protein